MGESLASFLILLILLPCFIHAPIGEPSNPSTYSTQLLFIYYGANSFIGDSHKPIKSLVKPY
jgi:hypothetical protein